MGCDNFKYSWNLKRRRLVRFALKLEDFLMPEHQAISMAETFSMAELKYKYIHKQPPPPLPPSGAPCWPPRLCNPQSTLHTAGCIKSVSSALHHAVSGRERCLIIILMSNRLSRERTRTVPQGTHSSRRQGQLTKYTQHQCPRQNEAS